MEFFRYIFLLCYVLYALHKSRRSKIYLLLFPFIIFFGEAAFFNRNWVYYKQFTYIDFEIFFLIVVWLITVGPFGQKSKVFSDVSTKILLIFSCFIFIDMLLTWASGSSIVSSVHLGIVYFWVVLAYFLFYDILKSFTRKNVITFLETLIHINTILAVFFIMDSGLGMNIHGIQKWIREWEMGVPITREFITFPGLTMFSFLYYLVYYIAGRKRNLKSIFIIAINLFCTLLQYTRSVTFIVLLMPLIVIFFYFSKKNRYSRVFSYSILYIGLFLILLLGIKQFAQPQYTYFKNRVYEVSTINQLVYKSTMNKRITMAKNSYALLQGINRVVGNGYKGREIINQFYQKGIFYRASDIMWSKLIIEMGIAGSFLFALFLILGIKSSFALWKSDNLFGLILFLMILNLVITTFGNSAFLGEPLLMFVFPIVMIEKGGLWRKEHLELVRVIRYENNT